MKSIRALATVVAVFGMSTYAQAGLLNHLFGHRGGGTCDGCDASKCCDCAPSCVPEVCKPVICRPCHKNVYEYQRRISCLKPPCCNEEANVFYDNCCNNDCLQNACAAPCGPAGCAPCAAPCGPGANACAPCGPAACAAPCGPGANACAPCGPAACAAPCGPGANACAPCGPSACAAPCGPGANACCPGGNGCCPAGNGCCGETCCRRDDACKVAKLIYKSQTACKPGDREDAIDDLGDYDIVCYPEIMCAMVYALNDCDPKVRAQAGDEIGDALEDNPCLATQCVIDALTCALADCDRHVVDQAEEALEAAGYEIVDCCETPCDVCCNNNCAPNACVPNGCAPMAQPVPMQGGEGPAPAPAPPEDTKAYFPKQLPPNTGRPLSKKFSLSKLFSMAH